MQETCVGRSEVCGVRAVGDVFYGHLPIEG